ncbi:uncharacterized protein I303_106163 [Kwoniella dejecticola CBS 10117]|uniref:ferric-chelate reductase (NADPH) n=1 Tax=Kwoniella dejecticola CBS 10117 TaxID=1296121 RepID=A0A1A6A1F8_9TREE|nr:uncharacterized protein I303_06181 [Kwoniella dejecticola CBS 10117]OBR83896.1 hypothetical protein I303_06181 [Kwoniella dejecticola CBS 10117]
MGLSQPVGYLYWYTTSIIIGVLTIINFSTKFYKFLTRPNKRPSAPTQSQALAITSDEVETPSSGSPNSSIEKPSRDNDVEDQIEKHRLGRLNRSIRTLSVMAEKYFYLSGVTVPRKTVRYKVFGKARKIHKKTYGTPEMFWTWGYTLGFLILCFYGTGWDTLTWCNQAAWLAVAQVPMIIALAGKNNLISFLTGIPYDRLNYIHRASAKLCLLGVWIHAGGHWRLTHGWNAEVWSKTISKWGFTGTFAITLLSLLSLPYFRRKLFEFFLVMHIVLVALMLAAFVMHWRAMDVWIYPGAALWAADRLLRVLRLVILNKLWIRPSLSASEIPSKATISLLTPSTLLLRFTSPSEHLNWSAGHHFYVVMPGMSRLPWEAHPFTASTIPARPGQGAEAGELAFIVRVRDGFTKRMKDKIDAEKKAKGLAIDDRLDVEVTAAVEGPYGEKSDMSGYEGVLMFSGGSGISFAVSNLLQILREIREGRSRVKFISIVWMVKSRLHLEWIAPLLRDHVNDLPPDLSINIHVHVTRHLLPKLSLTHNTLPDIPNGDFEAYLQQRSTRTRRRSRFMSTFSWASWTGGSIFRAGGTEAGTRRGSLMPSESGRSEAAKSEAPSEASDGSKGSKGSQNSRRKQQHRLFGSFSSSNFGGPSKNPRRSSHAVSDGESEGEGPVNRSKEKRRPSIPAFNWTEGYADNTVFGGNNENPGMQQIKKDSLVPYAVPEAQELEIVLKEPTPVDGVRSTAVMPEALTIDTPPEETQRGARGSIANNQNRDIGPDEVDPFDYRPPSPTTPPLAALGRRDSRGSLAWHRDSFSSIQLPAHGTPPRQRQISISDDLPMPRQKRISISEESPISRTGSPKNVPLPQSRSGSLSTSLPGTPNASTYHLGERKRSIPLLYGLAAKRDSIHRRESLPLQAAESIRPSSPKPSSILMPTPQIADRSTPKSLLGSSSSERGLDRPKRPTMLTTVHSSGLLGAPEMSRSSTVSSAASMASFTTPSPISPVQMNLPEEISRPTTPSMAFKQITQLTDTSPGELRKSISVINQIEDPKERRQSMAQGPIGMAELELRKKSAEGLEGLVRWHEGRADIKGSIRDIIESVQSHTQLSSKEAEGAGVEKRGGRVNVSCCGPISLLEAVKDGVKVEMDSKEVWKGGVVVDFHAETFGW